jgi:hypothetical protein
MNPGNVSINGALGMLTLDIRNTLKSCASEAGNSEATFYTSVSLLVRKQIFSLDIAT